MNTQNTKEKTNEGICGIRTTGNTQIGGGT